MNGHGWIFLLTLNNKKGSKYLQSRKILAYLIETQNLMEELSKDAVSTISLIIAYWV